MNKNRPIGIFDSGLGGLTVLDALRSQMPNEDFIYFADTQHVPYGEKPAETIRDLALSIVDFLIKRNVKLIAFGCNISSALAVEEAVKRHPEVAMMSLISPALAEEARKDSKGRIGVIATTATVATGRYPIVLKSGAEKIEVFMCACPAFVPLIENGKFSGAEVDAAVASSLEMLVSAKIDTMVFGCTHYPFLEAPIKAFFQKQQMAPRMVNPAGLMAQAVKLQLKKTKLSNIRLGSGMARFVVSGNRADFKQNLKKLKVPFWDSMVFAPNELDEELNPVI